MTPILPHGLSLSLTSIELKTAGNNLLVNRIFAPHRFCIYLTISVDLTISNSTLTVRPFTSGVDRSTVELCA